MSRALPLMHALSEIQDALEERTAPIYEAAELSTSQFHLLYLVHEGGSLRHADLAKDHRCVKSNISHLVATLERSGWLERTRDVHDQRVKWVSMTPAGRTRFAAVLSELSQLEELLRAELGASLVRRLELTCLLGAQVLDAPPAPLPEEK